ncbi:GNAT family N-acetyltransferase [Nocardia stercoris]|uniref:GNAT family N-acetyltransferase n=1 Tax=Nocardia stercoris TaxID=2483361 RepID=A0A3M2LL20_9NOCA|nr:GNAT family N-acetyltransferase [Nocardia stercoris]RMI35518.1 GNAT family N-acetyltransferase [Nocardia stercoris]
MADQDWQVLPLGAAHTRSLAVCHIECWREAHWHLVPRHLMDAFDVDRRAAQWERQRVRGLSTTVVAVATGTTEVIGFADAGAPRDLPAAATAELCGLYVRAAWYGTGLARELLDTVLDPATDTSLWVFDDNPRAQAFYRKSGFRPDGTRRPEPFTLAPEIRMIRPGTPPR